MATLYPEVIKEIRKEKTKETLKIQKQIRDIYTKAIEDIAKQAATAKPGSLKERWLKDYEKSLRSARFNLQKDIAETIKQGIKTGAELGVRTNTDQLEKLLSSSGITVSASFSNMLSQVQQNVMADIVKGNLYKDKKTLSERIWNYGHGFEKDLQYIMSQGLVQKKSAIELAEDLEMYVKPAAARETTWGKTYPNLRNKQVDYNAMRLARTSINHSYQTATIQTAQENPFIDGIEWQSALDHERTCQLCFDRHGKVYKPEEVPLDHPNGLCTMVPYISKNRNEAINELRDWIEGAQNERLDKWYKERNDFFIMPSEFKQKEEKKEEKKEKEQGYRFNKEEALETIRQQEWLGGLDKKDQEAIMKVIEAAPEHHIKHWARHGHKVKGEFYDEMGAYYHPVEEAVFMNLSEEDRRSTEIGYKTNVTTFFHEVGHLFDHLSMPGKATWRGEIGKVIEDKAKEDIVNYGNTKLAKHGKAGKKLNFEETLLHKSKAFNKELRDKYYITDSVQDIMEGLTGGAIGGHDNGMYGHGETYWVLRDPSWEMVAYFYEASVIGGEREKAIQQYFPTAYEEFNNYLIKKQEEEDAKELKKIQEERDKK